MQLINIGFGNMVSSARLLAIVSPDSAPIKRVIQDTDHVILSAIQPEVLAGRAGSRVEEEGEELP